MIINREEHNSADETIDYGVVQKYFNTQGEALAASASYMAHEFDLPDDSLDYRMAGELDTLKDWLEAVPEKNAVLDVGCGSGTWTGIFASRFKSVIGIERSPAMVTAARKSLEVYQNVEIREGDVLTEQPAGLYDLIFLGGLCMYLKDEDVVTLLCSLKEKLTPGGAIILRESTAQKGCTVSRGEYQALYRDVNLYKELFQAAEINSVEVRRNYAYTSMEIAIELVEMRRKFLPILPKKSPLLGMLTWGSLRLSAPLSLELFPRLLSLMEIPWPELQNHFFKLQAG